MSPIKAILSIGAMLLFGALEGWAFVSAGLVEPSGMKAQMRFASFGVMKMFLSAVGSSMVVQSLMEASGSSAFSTTRDYARKGLSPSVVALGSLILGAGMYMCGSGPTMMPSQLAANASTALYIILGAFAGGLAFGLTEQWLPRNCGAPRQPLDGFKKYASVALPLGVLLVAASFGLEVAFPSSFFGGWRSAATLIPSSAIPSVAGLIIGVNQVPLRLIAGRGQGGSTPVVAILSTATGGAVQPKHRITTWFKSLQTVYVYPGTFIGAYVAAHYLGGGFGSSAASLSNLSGGGYLWPTPSARVSNVDAFVGAFLMLFGARMADGCTCGHGITGFSELSPNSIIATCCIFGGGMAAALVGLTTGM